MLETRREVKLINKYMEKGASVWLLTRIYCHENRIALRWIVKPMLTGQIQTVILL